MERLTRYICDRAHGAEGVSKERLSGSYCRGQFEATAIVDRLATIEDILGDDYDLDRLRELVNQRMTLREDVAARINLVGGIPVDRLRELVEADRDGRCAIFPCKPSGVTVYQLRGKKHVRGVGVSPRYVSCATVWSGGDYQLEHQGETPCRKSDFGKTWFLSEDAAWKALKGEQK